MGNNSRHTGGPGERMVSPSQIDNDVTHHCCQREDALVIAPPQRRPLTIAQEEVLSARAWELSLDGHPAAEIARALELPVPTVRRMLRTTQQELRERNLQSAESKRVRVLEKLRLARCNCSQMYHLAMCRIAREERLHAEANAARALRGEPEEPPTPVATRAFNQTIGTALRAMNQEMKLIEQEAKYLGLHHLGREMAKRHLVQRQAEMLRLLREPLTIEVRVADPAPPGWDEPAPEDVYCVNGIPATGCPGHLKYCVPIEPDPLLAEIVNAG